jgi:hypothetical protein
MERPTFLDHLDCNVFDVNKLTLRSYGTYDKVIYLLDGASFPSRMAQRAAVLPGIAITDFSTNPAKAEQALFKELVLSNQCQNLALKQSDFAGIQSLISQFDNQSDNTVADRRMQIIRNGSSNKGIIKKLLADTTDET